AGCLAGFLLPRHGAGAHSIGVSRRSGMIRERGSMEMLEEGAHLLRAAPLGTVLLYLIGAIPFSLALLFFLADMTHSPFAAEHLASSSLVLAALLLFANVVIAIALLPQLARSFLGIEGDLARMGIHILNLATMAVAAALTWMAADPLLDAVYVLRCFYGESIATGEDLRAAF